MSALLTSSAERRVRRMLGVVLAIASLSAVACSSAPSTTAKAPVTYTADDGRFTAEFPDTPEREHQTVRGSGLEVELVTYMIETKDSAVGVGYADFPPVDDVDGFLVAVTDGAATEVDGTIDSRTDTTYLGQSAKDTVVTASEGTIHTRVFLVENRLYTITGVAESGPPAFYDRLLETFVLL